MKFYLLYLSFDIFFDFVHTNLHYLERIRELFPQPNTHKLLTLGVESAENPYSGAMNTIQ
jgi:hypothetical protein